MELAVKPSSLKGGVDIPSSKSHTIRAVVVASLARGTSRISAPLESADTVAAIEACRAFGARIETGKEWIVEGTAGAPQVSPDVIDVANSGTTLRLGMGVAALVDGYTIFTGDEQIRRRPVQPLLDAYRELGAEGFSMRGNGCAPVVIRGPIRGGRTSINAVTSQYLSSLLLAAPLAEGRTEIEVLHLNEKPYVEMTCSWLGSQGIAYGRIDWEKFIIDGGQGYRAFSRRIPADFSSATFFLCGAAMTEGALLLRGLDMDDAQGDKAVISMLAEMGAQITVTGEGIRIKGGSLKGGEFDLNATPDALPAMAVAASVASGETKLYNVPQARLKETDRIAVMAQELSKMGADIEELEDGLRIRESRLKGAIVEGHGDHRVVMALAVAGLVASGETVIRGAGAMSVTFPAFVELMTSCGAVMERRNCSKIRRGTIFN